MKRIFATILCMAVLLTCIVPFSASAEETMYGTIPVQFLSNHEEGIEYLDVMVQDGAVYVDCQAFAERLGYNVKIGKHNVSITDSTGWYESPHSTTSLELPYESTQVKKTFCGGNWCTRLESPFPTIYDGETVWVPLEYTALLLNSSVKILEDRVFIIMPEKKIPDLIYDILHPTLNYFNYDWSDAYENNMGAFFAQGSSSWVVSRLSRVLKADIWDNIRRAVESESLAGLTTTAEYGEKYATLFCTFSNDELKAETEKISAKTGIFSGVVKDMASDTSSVFDGELGSLMDTLDELKKQISSDDNLATNTYNAVDLEIEKLEKKYSIFEEAFSPYSKVQEGLEKPLKILDILCYAVDFVNYESEFYNQDKNSVAILKKYLGQQENLSSSVLHGIEGQLTALEKEGFNYGIIRSGFSIAGNAAKDGFTKLLGLPAAVMLASWDLASHTIPFYTEGFEAIDNFELSEVGIHVSQDSQSLLIKKEPLLTQGAELQNYYDLAQYSYNWLKSCYISRAAAIASLKTGKTAKNVSDFIDAQDKINKQVAWYLVRLKDVSNPADSKINLGEIINQYGIFPELNQKYLADYPGRNVDKNLINLVKEKNTSASDVFATLPSEFIFTSGVGGWGTVITLNDDGSFNGQYFDSDMGDTGTKYPNGTTYICNFSGKFTVPQKVNEYTYSMNLESLHVEGTSGTVYYEDGIRYILSDPYGFDDADEFLIYLPGCPLKETSEEFLSWSFIDAQIRDTIPMGVYGIYNVGGTEGFVGEDNDNLWRKTYIHSYNLYKSELWPSYSTPSHLVFWPESGAAILDLCFDWKDDNQREFVAYDSHGSGDYNISLDFSEDLTSVKVELSSMSGFNLEPWGGTVDGRLSVDYQVQ